MASVQSDSDEDDIFWGPITLKEIKASIRMDKKLKRWPVSLSPVVKCVNEDSNQTTSLENKISKEDKSSINEISKRKVEEEHKMGTTADESIISDPINTSCCSSNTSNLSFHDSKSNLNPVSPQTTPCKSNGHAETFSTPLLKSPSPVLNNSSLVSIDSSFLDASESSVQEVVSDSFEKMDPSKYIAEKIGNTDCEHFNDSSSYDKKLNSLVTPFVSKPLFKLDPDVTNSDDSFIQLEDLCQLNSSVNKVFGDKDKIYLTDEDALVLSDINLSASLMPLSETISVDSDTGLTNLINKDDICSSPCKVANVANNFCPMERETSAVSFIPLSLKANTSEIKDFISCSQNESDSMQEKKESNSVFSSTGLTPQKTDLMSSNTIQRFMNDGARLSSTERTNDFEIFSCTVNQNLKIDASDAESSLIAPPDNLNSKEAGLKPDDSTNSSKVTEKTNYGIVSYVDNQNTKMNSFAVVNGSAILQNDINSKETVVKSNNTTQQINNSALPPKMMANNISLQINNTSLSPKTMEASDSKTISSAANQNEKINSSVTESRSVVSPNNSNPNETDLDSGSRIQQLIQNNISSLEMPEAKSSSSLFSYAANENRKKDCSAFKSSPFASSKGLKSKKTFLKSDGLVKQSKNNSFSSPENTGTVNEAKIAFFTEKQSVETNRSNLNSKADFNESKLFLKNLNISTLNETELMYESPPSLFANTTVLINQSRISEPMYPLGAVQIKEVKKETVPEVGINTPAHPPKTSFSHCSNISTPKFYSSKNSNNNNAFMNSTNATNSKRLIPTKIKMPETRSTQKLDCTKSTSTNLKFDRLSPSNNHSSTVTPKACLNSSKEKTSSNKKHKFFTPSEMHKTTPNATSTKINSFIRPPKFVAPKPSSEWVLNSRLLPSKLVASVEKSSFQLHAASYSNTSSLKNVNNSGSGIPKISSKTSAKNTIQANQENVANSKSMTGKHNFKYKNIKSPVASYINDLTSPLSNTSLNSSSESNKSMRCKIPQQKPFQTSANCTIQSRLPRFNETSKIPKIPVLSKANKTNGHA